MLSEKHGVNFKMIANLKSRMLILTSLPVWEIWICYTYIYIYIYIYIWRTTMKGTQSHWQRTALHAWTSCVTQFCWFRVNQLFSHFGHSFTSTELLGADFHQKWLKSVIFRLAVDLNVAYFTRKHAVFKCYGGWSHCDKGHVWRINGNPVFPRILSLPLNERSLFLSHVNRL